MGKTTDVNQDKKTGKHNDQGGKTQLDSKSPQITDTVIGNDVQGTKNTHREHSAINQLSNDGVTRDPNVKVGKPQDQQKMPIQLTWLQRLWARVPIDPKEWIKNVHTQERQWGE